MREVPAESLPPRLRWLTLTDNAIEALPAALGRLPALQKLMLSGNALRALPSSLAEAPNLELLRIAANRFEAPPPWLEEHPALAWVAWAGNGFDRHEAPAARLIPWRELSPGPLLGQGASGLVHQALWREAPGAAPRPVALKLFKGTMTSDGLPAQEMAACLAAAGHPHLVGAIGRVDDHPEGADALVMPLVPGHWRALAGPPSLESCTRDVYDPALRLEGPAALRPAEETVRAARWRPRQALPRWRGDPAGSGAAGVGVTERAGGAAIPRRAGPIRPGLARFGRRRDAVRLWFWPLLCACRILHAGAAAGRGRRASSPARSTSTPRVR